MTKKCNAEYRNGANITMDVIRRLDGMLSEGPEQTTEEFFAKRDAAIKALMDAAGPIPSHAAGAMACLVELMVRERQNGGFF